MLDADHGRPTLGVETPYEAYLQTRLAIGPQANAQVTGLLEALFPRLTYTWW